MMLTLYLKRNTISVKVEPQNVLLIWLSKKVDSDCFSLPRLCVEVQCINLDSYNQKEKNRRRAHLSPEAHIYPCKKQSRLTKGKSDVVTLLAAIKGLVVNLDWQPVHRH